MKKVIYEFKKNDDRREPAVLEWVQQFIDALPEDGRFDVVVPVGRTDGIGVELRSPHSTMSSVQVWREGTNEAPVYGLRSIPYGYSQEGTLAEIVEAATQLWWRLHVSAANTELERLRNRFGLPALREAFDRLE